ncbi:MAG TPA: glycoside hydrolase family 38 C-terminal domain-containing protein, partial [Armatimonadota bacterium]|nr:glycoside hydrolase family 38 C-terminal domain-containing protein [Armatimonadota bacterium]
SICGCSLDRVHEDMVPRFKQAEEVAECVTERSLKHLAGKIDTTTEVEGAKPVCIFNPLSSDRVEVAEIEAEFPIAEGAPAHVRVIGSDGEAVPSQFLDMEDTHVRYLHPQKLPLSEHVRRFKLAVQAEVGSGGWDTLQVVASGPSTGGANGVSADAASLTNELISVHVLPGGSLAIVDLERDIEYGPCNVFASNGDVGDEYKMIPPTVDRLVTSVGEAATVSLETCGPLLGRLRIDTRLVAPECATEDRRKRSDRTVEIPITSWVTLKAGSRRVEIETQITNRAKDHRVRALFPSGVDTDVARADGQFDVVARPIQPPADWHGASTFAPQQGFVAVEDEDHGLAVINQGLPEYEVLPDAERTVALTLLRCVGRLSMSGDAGAMDAEYNYTPEAQCLDTYSFRYAVLPYAGTWSDAGIPDEAQQFNVPLRGVQTGVHGGELPASDSLVVLDADGLVLSTVKKAETDDRIIARVFNPTTEPKAGRIGVKGASRAELVALSEESIEE